MTVSSLAQAQQVVQNLQMLQSQGNTIEQQLATGLQSQSYSGYPTQAAQLVNLSATQSQQQSYINTIDTVNTRLQTMSLATSTIANLVEQFSGDLSTDAYNTQGTTIQSAAQSLLAQVGDYLNTQDGEGFVFSGSENSQPPYNPAGLPNPGTLSSSVASDYYQGNDDVNQAQVDNDLTVQYGVTANNPAFEQVVRVLNFLANSPPLSSSSATDVANVGQAQDLLNSAETGLQQLTANIGANQAELNSVSQGHQSSLTLAQTTIGNIENVDPATAISKLDTLQTQLEASYQAVSTLQSLSLANYLK